jgi:predicted histone-like DNA-binding protein
MINYSVAVRPNPGKDKTEYPTKAYAALQLTDVVSLDEFATHISEHGSVYNRGDILAILCQAVDCLREMILEGKKVQLGDLGAFYPSIRSTGAPTAAEFTSANIHRLTVNWSRGSSLVNMVGDASFRVMASRSVQSAAVAAQKAANGGDFTVNINSSGTSSSSTSGSSSSSGGGNSSSGGSTSGGDDSGDGGMA